MHEVGGVSCFFQRIYSRVGFGRIAITAGVDGFSIAGKRVVSSPLEQSGVERLYHETWNMAVSPLDHVESYAGVVIRSRNGVKFGDKSNQTKIMRILIAKRVGARNSVGETGVTNW